MQIEIHLPSGRLLAIRRHVSLNMTIYCRGDGLFEAVKDAECIPHSTMCGPFSHDINTRAEHDEFVYVANCVSTKP